MIGKKNYGLVLRDIIKTDDPYRFVIKKESYGNPIPYEMVSHQLQTNSLFSIGRNPQKLPSANPDIKCHIPQKAVRRAIPPKPSKKVKMSNNPNPEF